MDEPLDDTPLDDDVTRVDDGEYLADSVKVVTVPGHTPGIAALHLDDPGGSCWRPTSSTGAFERAP